MNLSMPTNTRSSQPLVPVMPASLGRELVPFSGPAEAEMAGTELVNQMFRVLSLQNEEVREEAERNFTAFQQNQQRMRETIQTLGEESRRLQAELTTTLGRYNELQTMTDTEKRAFQASIQRLTEEMRIKNEQIVRLEAKERELERVRTLNQTLTVENTQLRAELATYRAQATQQMALQQAQLTALENLKAAEIARLSKENSESWVILEWVKHYVSEINHLENEEIPLVTKNYDYLLEKVVRIDQTTLKKVIERCNLYLRNHGRTEIGRRSHNVGPY